MADHMQICQVAGEREYYLPPREPRRHVCDPYCCPFRYHNRDRTDLRAFRGRYGPLMQPLIVGWTRNMGKMASYIAPCGRSMRNFSQISAYLTKINCCDIFDVDNFTFEHSINCLQEWITDERFVLSEDLSNGHENIPIRVINEIDRVRTPRFRYVRDTIFLPDVKRGFNNNPQNWEFHCGDGCTCMDFDCACWKNFQIDKFTGYLHKRLNQPDRSGIYECNSNCPCSPSCRNRVVQQGIKHPLELFKTGAYGWGVRCRTDLPCGAFLCCYFGTMLLDEAAAQADYTYLANLGVHPKNVRKRAAVGSARPDSDGDEPPTKRRRVQNTAKGAQPGSSRTGRKQPVRKTANANRQLDERNNLKFVLDAKRCGNIARFFNHSCDPNVFAQSVFVETHDNRLPRYAFFTGRYVPAGTELRFDYNYKVGCMRNKRKNCECGSINCRGRLY